VSVMVIHKTGYPYLHISPSESFVCSSNQSLVYRHKRK